MQKAWTGNNYGRGPLLFYHPDQIGVLVSEMFSSDPLVAKNRYEALRQFLNNRLTDIAKSGPVWLNIVESSNPALPGIFAAGKLPNFASDLEPTNDTWTFLKSTADPLQQLPTLMGGAMELDPWVPIPKTDTTPVKTLCFYQVGGTDQPDFGPGAGVPFRAQRIRDLVNLVNMSTQTLTAQWGAAIKAVPNWLSAATGDGCPSPGSTPEWVPDGSVPKRFGHWSFQFEEKIMGVVNKERGRGALSNVVVAILDTSPTKDDVHNAANRYPNNRLLKALDDAAPGKAISAAKVSVDADPTLSIPEALFQPLYGVTTNWRDAGAGFVASPTARELRMDDHGLFIAGIIHDIAPMAETHLIRVLGGYGVSDSWRIIPILNRLPQLINNTQWLVVNMSLGFSIPTGVDLFWLWLKNTFGDTYNILTQYADLDRALANADPDPTVGQILASTLSDLRAGIEETMTFLGTHPQILIVAAAGNDNRWFDGVVRKAPLPLRPEPRWPARYDHQVIGVAAVGLAGQAAAYSNRGDVGALDNGVATFGGDAKRNADEDLGKIDMTATTVDAVIGLYTSPQLTLGPTPDPAVKNGWVYWSGTSFATPIIAGLAADFWAQDINLRPDAVRTLVVHLASGPVNLSDPQSLDSPTLPASQVWIP